MIDIQIISDSKYKINREMLHKRLVDLLARYRLVDNVSVVVEIVGKRKIKELNEIYLKHEGTTDVLSFPLNDPTDDRPFVASPDGQMYLGEIFVCYPVAMEEALERQVAIDVQVVDLAEHGIMHLLGFHHE
ncbi:MAG: rRNA maturation RNase YbeY [bacterium]